MDAGLQSLHNHPFGHLCVQYHLHAFLQELRIVPLYGLLQSLRGSSFARVLGLIATTLSFRRIKLLSTWRIDRPS